MIQIITQWFSLNFSPRKAEKNNFWTAMIGISSVIGTYTINRQIMPRFF